MTKAQQEYIGKRFGRLLVKSINEDKINNVKLATNKTRIFYNCVCDCGNVTIVEKNALKTGNTKSCGCFFKEDVSNRFTKHGGCLNYKAERLYGIYKDMKSRCYNKNNKDYKYYGDRGICICEEWLKDYRIFKEWSLTNGYNKNLTIDRIDVNGNYCPKNCRWITRKEQMNNTRANHLLTYNNETHTMMEWSEKLGISYCVIKESINKKGMTLEEFLNQYAPRSKPIETEYLGEDVWQKSGTYYLKYNQEILNANQWSKRLGRNSCFIQRRARKGWSAKKCIETPPRIN